MIYICSSKTFNRGKGDSLEQLDEEEEEDFDFVDGGNENNPFFFGKFNNVSL